MLQLKKLIWVGSSLKDLKDFPNEVMDEMGYALYQAQEGNKSKKAKPLKGFNHGVMEIVSNYNTNTYRAVYTTKIGETIYVLHCFQKKSISRRATPRHAIDLIKKRLREAISLSKM